MFLKYFEPLTAPFKYVRSRWMKVRNVEGRIRVDVGRVKSYKALAKYRAKEAKQMALDAKKKAGQARDKAQAMRGRASGQQGQQLGPGGPVPAAAMAGGSMGGQRPMGPGAPMHGGPMMPPPMAYHPPGGGPPGGGPPMAPGGPPGYPPRPAGGPGAAPGWGPPGPPGFPGGGPPPVGPPGGIVVTGALWWKKHLCAQCGQQLDKTWDRCPYCSQGQAPSSAMHKTQAIMVDAAGTGNGLQLCGWLVPLKGAQRGELFTLEPVSSIGTDPACTVVLNDSYMSSRHCEIRAEGGIWVLRDLRSTNGTYVNDRRVEQHELVDSDFVRVGQSVLKFKSL